MGNIFANLFDKFFSRKPLRLLMVGLDAAGKTTILYKLKLGQVVTTISTVGFNVERIEYKNTSFTVWDVGGGIKIHALWKHYFHHAQGVIFVVDSSDRERIFEAGDALLMLMEQRQDQFRNAVLLVLANKQDLPNAMCVSEMMDKLGLHKLKTHNWYIQPTCAITGDGLYEALDWLLNDLTKQYE